MRISQLKIELTKYSELAEYIGYFQQGVYELLIIESKPGYGKSTIVRDQFRHLNQDTDFLWLEGRTSAAAFYEQLYSYVDCPVVLDDTDDFLQDKQCLTLLKTLCQTDSQAKKVSWLTTRLPNHLPPRFYTSSTVIILTNETRRSNIHLKAIQDRGLHVHFRPDKQEIHHYAKKLCNNEVYSFIDLFLPSIEELTLRLYVQAQVAYDKQIPWKNTLVLSWQLDPLMKTYLEIELAYPDKPRDHKQDIFCKVTGKQAKTYDRITHQLKLTDRPLVSVQTTPGRTHTAPGKATPGKATPGKATTTQEKPTKTQPGRA